MSTEENKALARRLFEEGINQRNWAVLDELCTPDFVLHNVALTLQGLEPVKQFLSMYLTAFPDAQFTIEDLIAEGDKVVVRETFRGTHQGDLMGIPPTGKQVTVSAIVIVRIVNGKAVEGWQNGDTLGTLQQLGVVPAQGQPE
jgi:predicted ester cyclase